jgi:hypothetical protein
MVFKCSAICQREREGSGGRERERKKERKKERARAKERESEPDNERQTKDRRTKRERESKSKREKAKERERERESSRFELNEIIDYTTPTNLAMPLHLLNFKRGATCPKLELKVKTRASACPNSSRSVSSARIGVRRASTPRKIHR